MKPSDLQRAEKRLVPQLRYWIRQQGWSGLRDVQIQAIPPILAANRDVILIAETAGGKTEAAYLPILSRLSSLNSRESSVQAISISPLKALINDQFQRIEPLARSVGLSVCPWHGDAPWSKKCALVKNPKGILLITPESLEAMFIRLSYDMRWTFNELKYIIVDELHAFIGSERGRQLQSLLNRLELAIARRIPRIALSATLGDLSAAAEFLRPGDGGSVEIIQPTPPPLNIGLCVRGYVIASPKKGHANTEGTSIPRIVGDLHERLKNSSNLIFTNSRRTVESLTYQAQLLSEADTGTETYLPHHGNLSAQKRHLAEKRLKDKDIPATAVCTSTLELGIDIGAIENIAQIGCPPSVSSLRQRIGRSGRTDAHPPAMRIMITEKMIEEDKPSISCLRPSLVQTIAMIELMGRRWCEPQREYGNHLSTFIQQLLSVVAEHMGIEKYKARKILCVSGPFRGIKEKAFDRLVAKLMEGKLLKPNAEGALFLADYGLKTVSNFKFYAAFNTPVEYRLLADGHEIGTIPLTSAIKPDSTLIFAGRSWRVERLDERKRIIDLHPSKYGELPIFPGGGILVHDEVRKQMRGVYSSSEVPIYLDAQAREFLDEGRSWFEKMNLDRRSIVAGKFGSLVFPWAGDRIINALTAQLICAGVLALRFGLALLMPKLGTAEAQAQLEKLARKGFKKTGFTSLALANKRAEKWGKYIPPDLLAAEYAARLFDEEGARETLEIIVERESR